MEATRLTSRASGWAESIKSRPAKDSPAQSITGVTTTWSTGSSTGEMTKAASSESALSTGWGIPIRTTGTTALVNTTVSTDVVGAVYHQNQNPTTTY